MNIGIARLETDKTVIEKRTEDHSKIPKYNLARSLIDAIKAYDAANPDSCPTLQKLVSEGLANESVHR